MKKSLRKTIAFICALTLTAGPLTLSARSLPAFAEETVIVQSESGEVTQEQIEKNIVGTWVLAEVDGQPALTNDKSVFTIVSPTEAYSSVSRVNAQGSPWHSHTECDITIDGNVVTITNHTESGTTIEHQFAITEISSDSFTANRIFMRSSKNAEPRVTEDIVTFVKTDDNAEVVFGTWQGVCTSGDYEFDDGNEHRWEYKPDGTYVYYSKKGNSWVPIDSANCEYFVAGNLMFTRWFDPDGNEFREQWEFTVENGKMSWTALRANEDGSTFTATFEMNKVGEVTQEQIEKNIVGTWIVSEIDGQAALTNEKSVYTIVSPTEAFTSVSRVFSNRSPWHSPSQCDFSINGNIITFNITNGRDIEYQYTITKMDSDTFTANRKSTRSSKNGELQVKENVVTLVRVDDLSEAVLGTWEGKCTSEGSVFDDGKEHRWEYKADGTYVYYNKVDDEWVASDNSENEYFVAGNLLCTRWVDNGTENREWWEISIKDGKMSWTALRANEDGSTFTATFEMNKIEENTAVKHKISDEEIVQWTSKDYKDKTGTNANAAITKRSDDKYEITLTDDEGNVLDTYTVNPDTGIGTNEVGEEVDLPQTGINTMGAASAISGAVLMAAAGAWMIFKSSKKKEEEE